MGLLCHTLFHLLLYLNLPFMLVSFPFPLFLNMGCLHSFCLLFFCLKPTLVRQVLFCLLICLTSPPPPSFSKSSHLLWLNMNPLCYVFFPLLNLRFRCSKVVSRFNCCSWVDSFKIGVPKRNDLFWKDCQGKLYIFIMFSVLQLWYNFMFVHLAY